MDELIPGVETAESTASIKLSAYFKDAVEGNSGWRNRAKKGGRFYTGDQWDSADKQKLDSEGRPYLTINQIAPTVNVVSGTQRQNRMDIKVLPRRGGTAPIANTLTELAKHAQDSNNAAFHDSMMFLDGLITGKGWLGMDVNYDNDLIYGDLSVFRISGLDMYEDPNAKEYDLNDSGRFVTRCHWWNKEVVDKLYPKLETDTEKALADIDPGDEDIISTSEEDTYKDNEQTEKLTHKDSYRCKEFYWKTWEKRTVSVDTRTGQVIRVPNNKVLALLKQLIRIGQPIKIIDRVVPVLHKTTMVGKMLAGGIKDDPFNGITTFPYFRFCPFWIDGYIFGMVDNLIDPQNEINKRRSQILHHLNSSSNSGFMYQEGALSPDEENNLKDFGSTPGVHIKYNKGFDKPERIMPSAMSEGHLVLAKESEGDIKRVSGVNSDMLGLPQEKRESGIMMSMRQRQGAIATEIVNDNYKYTKKIYGTALVDVIRMTELYSEEEIQSILTESKVKPDMQALRDFKTGRYGVTVSESQSSPTIRMANLSILLDAFKQGVPIPMDLIIEMSDLPHKEEVIARIKAQMEAQPNPEGAAPGKAGPIKPTGPGNPQPGG